MSLTLPVKRKDISVRKDINITTKPLMRVRKDAIVSIPQQIKFNTAFLPNQAYQAASIYDFCRNIMYSWFPPTNFTRDPISGSLTINGSRVGNLEFIVVPGQSVTAANQNNWFSQTKDTASSFIFVKGNLSIDSNIVLTPQITARKLFTVLYIAGNLTFGNSASAISMTQRGANHSGTGTSGGATTEVDIQIGPATVIAATGAQGARANVIQQTANVGRDSSRSQGALETGGGGGGWWDAIAESTRGGVGAGANGTCFSGGSGSGGTYSSIVDETGTLNAAGRGGAGSDSAFGAVPLIPESAAGAGNPDGNTDMAVGPDPFAEGTGGSLILFVEGTITTAGSTVKHFSANGTRGRQMTILGQNVPPSVYPFGGGTGGGIVILVNNDALGLAENVEANGGVVASGGPSPNFQSGGNGAAVTYTFAEL